MAITGACIVTFLVWKNWSISKPVAVVADKAGQEAAKVSGKAVEGLQDASQSLKQWHERRRIFDCRLKKPRLFSHCRNRLGAFPARRVPTNGRRKTVAGTDSRGWASHLWESR